MLQSGITDHRKGQFKSACLKLQPIKLTVLLNSAWAELSNTDWTMSVQVYTAVQGSHLANFKSACLKLQPIKLTVLLNSA